MNMKHRQFLLALGVILFLISPLYPGSGENTGAYLGELTWPEAGARIKITVIGTDDASFSVSIDLPGIANDQSMVFNLKGGYFETEITI